MLQSGVSNGHGTFSWGGKLCLKRTTASIHQEQRKTNSSPSNITKSATYYLNLAEGVTQVVYPTGRTVNYTYDSANRPSTAADASNGITYATGWQSPPSNTSCTAGAACYTPQGTVYGMSLGQTTSFTGFNLLESFNNRLQPSEIKASSSAGNAIDITYNFVDPTSGGNAGHVYGITNNLNSGRSQTFTYDQLNRILTAGSAAKTGTYCWGYSYTYDVWGNLLSQGGQLPAYRGCTQVTMGSGTADANNHLSALTYDFSGNTQSDGISSYTWDGESQLKTAAGVTYNYDGDGRRVAKVGSKLYWYGSGGEILVESDAAGNTQNEYVFFGGKRVAMVPASGNALYYAGDLLGSSRVIVQSDGTLCYDADFVPFGGERAYTSACAQNYKFEGKERDTETQNDDFGARYYSWRFGRWLSADWSAVPVPVPYANLTNPQTLNLYAMVADDPESFADLGGHDGVPFDYERFDPHRPSDNGKQTQGMLDPSQLVLTAQTPSAQNTASTVSTQEVVQNTTTGAVIGGVAGAIVGGIAGGAGGTLVEPGGGTLVGIGLGGTEGAKDGAVAGAVVGATAGVVYTESKDALNKVGKHIETALEHLGKLANSPDQNPRNKWKDTVRKSADNIDKQSNRIANKTLGNAGHYVADLLRGLVD